VSARVGASLIAGLTLLLAIAAIPLTEFAHQALGIDTEVGGGIALTFAAVGMVIARREPRNSVGWVLLATGFLLILSTLGDAGLYLHADYGLHHGSLPLGSVAILIGQAWPAPLLLGPLAIVLFPDGRVSGRWRMVVWAYVAGTSIVVLSQVFVGLAAVLQDRVRVDASGDLTSSAPKVVSSPVIAAALGLVLLVIVCSAVSFVVRQVLSYHRSTGDRRQQLKWVMCGAVITAGAVPIFIWHPGGSSLVVHVLGFLSAVGIAALPLSIGVAILRYRLYEIDRLISRTLSYAIVTAILVGLYLGLVGLTADALSLSSPLAVAAATLTAAALFNPLRTRVQRRVDRRFNRARYDAEATVVRFAVSLRDAVDLDMICAELVETAQRSLEPAQLGLWLQSRPGPPDR
jgi:hypothetical protein